MNTVRRIVLNVAVIFLFHVYLVGGLLAAFTAADRADWNAENTAENSLKASMTRWYSEYLNPLHTFRVLVAPQTEEESQVSTRTWIAAPIVIAVLMLLDVRSLRFRKGYKVDSGYGSHGSARWARNREIFRRGELTGSPVNELETAGVVLGYMKPAWYQIKGKKKKVTLSPDSELNQNVLVYGGSGIGKGFTYIKTQIYHTMEPFDPVDPKRKKRMQDRLIPREYSLFTIDPKGENLRDTAPALIDEGYEVYSLNLVNMKASHRWNAMDYVNDDLDAEKLANLIISNSRDGHTGGDPFWERSEKALMSAIILFVKRELPPEQQNLSNVINIGLTYGRNQDEMNLLFDSLPYNHEAVAKYNIFRMAEEQTRAGILIGFATQLSLFANRQISHLTSQSDFRLDDMGRRKIALFLIIPDSDTTYAQLTSLFITQALQQWWRVADENQGTCPVGIRMLGDEIANVGRIPMLAERTSVMRQKGISIQIVLQAKSQLDKLYKDDAKIIIQNCDTTVFLGTNDSETAKEMAETLGDMTIETTSTSQQQAVMSTAPVNESKQHLARKLMTPDELKRNSRLQNIIIQNGSYPFRTLKTPFIEHPRAKDYRKLDPNSIVPPAHKGFELFSREDFERICGLVLEVPENAPSAAEVKRNFDRQTGEILEPDSENIFAQLRTMEAYEQEQQEAATATEAPAVVSDPGPADPGPPDPEEAEEGYFSFEEVQALLNRQQAESAAAGEAAVTPEDRNEPEAEEPEQEVLDTQKAQIDPEPEAPVETEASGEAETEPDNLKDFFDSLRKRHSG